MAKAAKKKIETITTQAEADELLRDIGRLEDKIATIHARESEIIRLANERAVAEAKPLIDERKMMVEELEAWARENEKEWEQRTLTLTFGRLYFRLGKPAIKLLRKAETILERLRAQGMQSCIRVKEEIDKEALAAYDADVLSEVGCKRMQRDEFYYEVFRPEVK